MKTGIYEQIINQLFEYKLASLDEGTFYVAQRQLTKADAVAYLSRYLYDYVHEVLSAMGGDEDMVDKSIALVNELIRMIGQRFTPEQFTGDLIAARASLLTAIVDKTNCDYPDISHYLEQVTPLTSLTRSTLFTGRNQSISMVSELKKEISSSDEVCLLVSFIKQSGLNLLLDELRDFTSQGKTLRVITTTYMGATDFSAVKRLSLLPHTEVKISYNTDLDRLHAKAYLFLRQTGYHTSYIGSSNLSGAALTSGLEWNIKATQAELPQVVSTVKHTFDTYWADPCFETFVPERDDERLQAALKGGDKQPGIDYTVLDLIGAKEYQQEVLEKLEAERLLHNSYRNLVVAATGTGKTVIAAFDYKRFCVAHPRGNLLFIAHREEILKQACATFRQVMGDENFGDLWYGKHHPESRTHLFASKDMLNSRWDDLNIAPDYYDYIVFDEVHHISALSYRRILDYFKPKILLGLTATPERMDGNDITADFGGKISAEIRLDTALNNRLLVPFHYYGVTDAIDLSEVKWARGRYVASELTKVYTANDRRTNIILKALERYISSPQRVRALGFCVDKEHAEYMAAKFTLAGLKADVLTSDNGEQRVQLLKKLRKGSINYLFVVDMFNEGVDIPEIDTVLFLRPTESVTIFLQQLGRGLRKSAAKEQLTVLDFVGHSRSEFNYIDRFRAMMGKTSMSVPEEIEYGFPHLPTGCQIELEEKARTYILSNIRSFLSSYSSRKIVSAIKRFASDYDQPLTLGSFIKMHHLSLEKVYKKGNKCWSELCNEAGVSDKSTTLSRELARAVYAKWLLIDAYTYFATLNSWSVKGFVIKVDSLVWKEQQMLLMFYYDLFQTAGRYSSLQQMVDELADDKVFVNEMQQLMPLLMQQCNIVEQPDNSTLSMRLPLMLHGQYTKDQILVALGTSTLQKKSSCREGVERNKDLAVEAMFVDLIKDRELGSTTNYNDYAVSPTVFHWETQNSVRPETQTGRNYIEGRGTYLLFVRQQAKLPDDKNRTMGYIYLGEVTLQSYSGSRPMQIVWNLKTAMPASVYGYAGKFAALG